MTATLRLAIALPRAPDPENNSRRPSSRATAVAQELRAARGEGPDASLHDPRDLRLGRGRGLAELQGHPLAC
eukprot:2861061-Pyramimonas_sp.AAC.1